MKKDATLKQAKKVMSIFKSLSTEKMQEILGSGLLADLRDGNVSGANRDAIRKLLELGPIKEKILEVMSAVKVSANVELFIAKEKFVVNIGSDAKVKISYLGENFRKRFLGKIEKPNAENTMHFGKLLKNSLDDDIIDELGGKDNAKGMLCQMFSLIEVQSNGEDGVLLTNGYANIFYVLDDEGVLWAVCCNWLGDGWGVNASSVDDSSVWPVGDRVFSCNSFVS